MHTTTKGFVISLDLAFSVLTIMVMLFVAISHFSSETMHARDCIQKFALEKNALLIADAVVKNSNENPALGAAVFDEEKRRVKSNELDLERLRERAEADFGELFVRDISLEQEVIFEQSRKARECIAVERFVLAPEKSIIKVVVCEK